MSAGGVRVGVEKLLLLGEASAGIRGIQVESGNISSAIALSGFMARRAMRLRDVAGFEAASPEERVV